MARAHILVVDDEPINLEIIAELLEGPEYLLDLKPEAASALQALEAEGAEYDLIILDRMMPGMSGLDFLRQIKADPRYQHIPVIMQTAAASPEQVREGVEAGAYYYLTKPYDPAALLLIVNAVFEDQVRQRKLTTTLRDNQRQLAMLQLMTQAEFSFSGVQEVADLSSLLASLCPSPDAVVLGLSELMMNAVEHGNLEITYQEKTELKRAGNWAEEIAKRSVDPTYCDRRALVRVVRNLTTQEICFTISDQGKGFDWHKFLEFDPARAFDPNGRGIAMARQISFARLEYQGNGNQVLAVVKT